MKKIITLLFTFVILLILSNCPDNPNNPSRIGANPITSISYNNTTLCYPIGTTIQPLRPTITPIEATNTADSTNKITFSATSLPTGLTIDPITGIITGTTPTNPLTTRNYTITVRGNRGNAGTTGGSPNYGPQGESYDGSAQTTISIEVIQTIQVFGYRLINEMPQNDDGNISFQVAEGHIFDGANTDDLLENVTPTGSAPNFSSSLANFNDGNEGRTSVTEHLFHANGNTTNIKMIQVLGTNQITANNNIFRIQIFLRERDQSGQNGIRITLLDQAGEPIGTSSQPITTLGTSPQIGFIVDFNAITGEVLTQPTIFTNGSLPALPNNPKQ